MASSATISSASPYIGLFVQPECLKHVSPFRGPDISYGAKFERPERILAVLGGVAAGIARLEEADRLAPITSGSHNGEESTNKAPLDRDAEKPPSPGSTVTALLGDLKLEPDIASRLLELIRAPPPPSVPGAVLLGNRAVQIAHSPPEESFTEYMLGNGSGYAVKPSSAYLSKLNGWFNAAEEKFKASGVSELPEDEPLAPGDMYLSMGTLAAIEGSIQTVCQAVDQVCGSQGTRLANAHNSSAGYLNHEALAMPSSEPAAPRPADAKPASTKAFCVIRPPGHHCGESSPSGFCWINNAMVAATHAYLDHNIDRVIIIDIDLHHGNGTQKIVMAMNRAAVAADKQKLGVREDGTKKRSWRGFYGSVHDIESFPCEDGQEEFVKDASISLAAHGQHIENIHLDAYNSEKDFYERIYPRYTALLEKARNFVERTQADPKRCLVLVSAGFDACEHEHEGMQRHKRHVPVSFYSSFTRDIVRFADAFTGGKIVSVLEGGYSDMALASAAMGHVIGLLGQESSPSWRTKAEFSKILRATQVNMPLPFALSSTPYLVRAHSLACHFAGTMPSTTAAPGDEPRQLRERRNEPRAAYTPPQTPARRGRTKVQNAGDRPSSKSKSKRRSSGSKQTSPKEKQQALPPGDRKAPSPKSSPNASSEDVSKMPPVPNLPSVAGMASAVSKLDIKPEQDDAEPVIGSRPSSPKTASSTDIEMSLPPSPLKATAPSAPPKVILKFRNPLLSSQPAAEPVQSQLGAGPVPLSQAAVTPEPGLLASLPNNSALSQVPPTSAGLGFGLALDLGSGENNAWRERNTPDTDVTTDSN